MKKYENINPTEAEKMMYFNAGLYPIKRVKNQDMDFIKYGVTTIEDVNVYPSFITAYSYRSSITFDNKCQFIHFDNVIIQLQLMDILCQRCDELKWEFPHINNELIMGVKVNGKKIQSETMKNYCISLLIHPNTFIEGLAFLAKHYDDLFNEFVSDRSSYYSDFARRDPFHNIDKFILKEAIHYSSANDISLTCIDELLKILNTKEFADFTLSSEPLCMMSESCKNQFVKEAIATLSVLFINYVPK